jgi:hypothetical protein
VPASTPPAIEGWARVSGVWAALATAALRRALTHANEGEEKQNEEYEEGEGEDIGVTDAGDRESLAVHPCLSKLGGVAREVRLPHIGAGGSASSAALCTPITAPVLLVGPALISKAHFLVVRRWARAAAADVHTAGAHLLTHGRRGAAAAGPRSGAGSATCWLCWGIDAPVEPSWLSEA